MLEWERVEPAPETKVVAVDGPVTVPKRRRQTKQQFKQLRASPANKAADQATACAVCKEEGHDVAAASMPADMNSYQNSVYNAAAVYPHSMAGARGCVHGCIDPWTVRDGCYCISV